MSAVSKPIADPNRTHHRRLFNKSDASRNFWPSDGEMKRAEQSGGL